MLFFFAGAFAVAVNIIARVLLSNIFSYGWAVTVAYLVGMATAFSLNKLIVFDHSGKSVYREIFWFSVVNLLGIIQVWSVSVGLAEYLFPRWNFHWHPELVAHALGVAPLAITSYLGHKLLSFGRRRGHEAAE